MMRQSALFPGDRGAVCQAQRCLHAWKSPRGYAVYLLLLSSVFVGPTLSKAQNAPARGNPAAQNSAAALFAVSGVVLDPSELAIVGAKVTLQTGRGANERSTVTDASGDFRFDRVSSGNYELEVQLESFSVSKTRLKVGPREPSALRIILSIASLNETISVGAVEDQVSSEVGENADTIKLSSESLRTLPILGNDVIAAATAMLPPGAAGPDGATLVIDGVPASELTVPASAIQEIKINQNPYSAEFAAPGQSRIEITTKAGSSHYHGSLDTEFRDSPLDARNAFAIVKPPEQHMDFDGFLSGPLGQGGKTTFNLSGEREQDDLQSIINALVSSGSVTENFPRTETTTLLSAGVIRQVNDHNTLSFRYSFYDWSDQGKGVGGFSLPESAANTTSRRHYFYVSDRDTLTPHLINELSVRLGNSDILTQSQDSGRPRIVVLGAFTGGSAQLSQSQSRNYLQLTDTLYWSAGKHVIKAGLNVPEFSRYGLNDQSNFGGTFQFSSLADYQLGQPFSFVQQQGNPRLVYWYKVLGAFFQDDIRLRPDFSISVGVRYDWQSFVADPRAFAPRLAFAYAPGKVARTVFRGGAGIFYQTTGAQAIADVLRFNGQTLRQIVLSNPGYPNPFALGGDAQLSPSSLVQLAPGFRLPYVMQYSFSVERQLRKSMIFTATYSGIQAFDLFRSRDINAPLPPSYVQRPDPAISTLRQIESAGRSQSKTLALAMRGKMSRYFSGMVQYALGQSYDDTGGINWFPANQYDPTGEWSRSDFDARHSFNAYGTFNAGKFFTLGMNMSARSGQPYTETTGTDDYGTTFANARPPGVARNSLQGPGAVTLNLRLGRDFALRSNKAKDPQRDTLSFALDAFNVLNHVNFGQPVGDLTSPFFGQPITAGSPRHLQVSLGFQF
jgi:carboxypeptidase family protein